MPERANVFLNHIKNKWTLLDSKTQRRVVLFSILFLISIAVATAVLSRTEYAVLYSGLDIKESGEIFAILEDLNIKAKSGEDGTILVDKGQEDNIRMQLAVQGYPKSGLNYDLYLNSVSFTTSTTDKNIMLLYQLQDRLSSTIKLLQGVKDAIVTISMETDNSFKFGSENNPVSANVLLQLENNFHPSAEQIRAIQKLLVTSITGLKDENVAIIDSNLNDLLPAVGDSPYGAAANTQLLLKQEVETELTDKIMYLFEPVFGAKNIKVAVNAAVDLDRITTEIIEYSPVIDDEGIPYIIDELSERYSDSTTNNNAGSDSLNDRMQTVINYRVNELRQTVEQAQGNIQDISISILINNMEMDVATLEDVKRIAAAAVGIETARINVSYMDFTAHAALEQSVAEALSMLGEEEPPFPISEKTLIGLVAIVLSFIFAVILFFSLRRRSAESKKVKDVASVSPHQLTEEPITSEALTLAMMNHNLEENLRNSEEDKVILSEIERIIKANPKSTADIITYWLDSKNSNQMLTDDNKDTKK